MEVLIPFKSVVGKVVGTEREKFRKVATHYDQQQSPVTGEEAPIDRFFRRTHRYFEVSNRRFVIRRLERNGLDFETALAKYNSPSQLKRDQLSTTLAIGGAFAASVFLTPEYIQIPLGIFFLMNVHELRKLYIR